MMRPLNRWTLCLIAGMLPAPASAEDAGALTPPAVVIGADAPASSAAGWARAWRVDFADPTQVRAASATPPETEPAPLDIEAPPVASGAQAPVRRPVAYVYSDGYQLRARIHKYASFATLPLFGAQYLLGRKLDEGTGSESVRASHAAIATTMVGLFGVNTVTGAWNLWEGRQNPAGRTRRLVHALLMLGSDAGFVATGLLAPDNDGGGNRQLHKTVALTSIGTATAGYLLMLLGQ